MIYAFSLTVHEFRGVAFDRPDPVIGKIRNGLGLLIAKVAGVSKIHDSDIEFGVKEDVL